MVLLVFYFLSKFYYVQTVMYSGESLNRYNTVTSEPW